ncbi:MAG TPA: pyrroline-5-carboxylate reductase [Methylophilaceae bacterium]|jgi:pyrroline-5-carboxylate reductase
MNDIHTSEQKNHPAICFVGGGNMARALIGGMLLQNFPPERIHVIESDGDKRAALQKEYAVQASDQLPNAADSDIIVLAVKPQQLRDVAIFLGSLLKHQLLISIAAGVRISDLSRWLGGYRTIVRVMPNTPAQIRLGVSALYANRVVSEAQRRLAETLLQAVGHTLWLDDESQMDAVTAISGSGPAYVFYLMEALQEAAEQLGFTQEQARMLSLQTFAGASQLALHSSNSPAELRQQVTSKGGTTERALESLEASGVRQALVAAAQATAQRSKELGDILGSDQS